LEEVHTQKWRKSKLILVVLLLLTFSRAAWLGAVLGWIYVRFLQQKKFSFYLLNFTALVFLASLVYIFYLREKIETDLSFQSKFEIVEIVLSHFKNATLVEWLLGIGFSNSLTVLDIYAQSVVYHSSIFDNYPFLNNYIYAFFLRSNSHDLCQATRENYYLKAGIVTHLRT
jgi:hypothetical protein